MGKMTYKQTNKYETFKEVVKGEILAAVENTAVSTSAQEDVEIAEAVLTTLIYNEWLDLPEYEED